MLKCRCCLQQALLYMYVQHGSSDNMQAMSQTQDTLLVLIYRIVCRQQQGSGPTSLTTVDHSEPGDTGQYITFSRGGWCKGRPYDGRYIGRSGALTVFSNCPHSVQFIYMTLTTHDSYDVQMCTTQFLCVPDKWFQSQAPFSKFSYIHISTLPMTKRCYGFYS